MSQDNPSSQEPETHEPYQKRQDSVTPVSIATTDPSVESALEHQSDWKRCPDSTVSVATTQMCEPNLLHVAGVRSVVIEDQPRGEDRNPRRDTHDEARQDQGRGKNQGDQRARRRG